MIKFAVKLVISLSIIVFLVSRTEFDLVIERLSAVDLRTSILAVSILFLLVIPQAFRWLCILRVSHSNISFRPALSITMVGWFFNQLLPSSVGGDAIRIWYAKGLGVQLGTATQSVIFDRLTSLVAITTMLVLFAPWLNRLSINGQAAMGIAFISAALFSGLVFVLVADRILARVLPVRWGHRLVEFAGTSRRIFLSRTGLVIIVISLLVHLCVGVVVWLLAGSMGIILGLSHALILMPLVLFISAIPISIAGWGLRESAMVTVFGLVGMTAEAAMAVSIGFGLSMLIAGLPGGVVWMFLRNEDPAIE